MQDETPVYGRGDASFLAAGGVEGIEALVARFYAAMDRLPEARGIRAQHPEDLTEAADKLARFLCGWLGGPRRYDEKYGPIRIPVAHAHLPIGAAERDAWLLCMHTALRAAPFEDAFKRYLLRALMVPAERIRTVCEARAERAGGSRPAPPVDPGPGPALSD